LFAKQFLPNFGGVTLFLNYNYVGLQRKKIDFTEKNRFIFFVSFKRNFRQTSHTGDTLMKGLRRLKVGGGGFAKYTELQTY